MTAEPAAEYVDVGLDRLPTDQVYHFLMSAVVPRPIALVTTIDAQGVVNAAPFSSFVVLSPLPPTIGIVVGSWEGRRKDTLRNVTENGEFVVHVVTTDDVELVRACAQPLPHGVSELGDHRAELVDSVAVRPPRLRRAPVALECRMTSLFSIGEAPDRLLAGRIEKTHVRSDCWQGNRLRPDWSALARVGGGRFAEVSRPFR